MLFASSLTSYLACLVAEHPDAIATKTHAENEVNHTSTCRSIGGLILIQEHKGILSLPQDCFYRDLTPDEAANIKSFNFDHPSAYAFPEIISAVQSLKAGNAVDIPVYDFVSSKRFPAAVHVPYAGECMFEAAGLQFTNLLQGRGNFYSSLRLHSFVPALHKGVHAVSTCHDSISYYINGFW